MRKFLSFSVLVLLGSALAWATPLPVEVLGKLKYAVPANKVTATKMPGTGNQEFRDLGPEPGLLTGFHVTFSDFMGLSIIKSVQPIFQTESATVNGSNHGKPGSKSKGVVARDGYAVGGIHIRAGMFVNGFSVTFMKVEGWGLNPQDNYESEWLGANTGGSESTLGGDGSLVVGICGKTANDKQPDKSQAASLGLILIPSASKATPKLRK